MPNFAANLSFMYLDKPLPGRIAAAAKRGFRAVEYMFPYEESAETLKKALDDNKVQQVLINCPAGAWDKGDRGLAAAPGRDDEFKASIEKGIQYALALGCPRLNVMCGKAGDGESRDKVMSRLVERYAYAADQFAKHKLTVIIEHINGIDMPGYFGSTPALALELVKKVNKPNFKIQYDVYHAQRMAGELTNFLKDNLTLIEHMQIADNPGRHQPGTGEINYRFFLDQCDKLGYKGWIGLEYKPEPDADNSLGWVAEYGYKL